MSTINSLSEDSDRMVLTVRVCSDGNREWLSSDGRYALVYFERNYWWGRRSYNDETLHFNEEVEALDYVLRQPLADLREKMITKHPGSYR